MVCRVCHISTMTRWGGVERMLVDFLTHVDQTAVTHYLLTTSSISEVIQPVVAAGIEWFQPTRRWRYDYSAVRQMATWLRQNEIDVVHSYNAFANSWGYIAAKLASVPVFFTGEHGSILSTQLPMNWTDKWAQRRATAVIANSEASKKILNLKYQVHSDKIYIVPNAVAPITPVNTKTIRENLGVKEGCLVVGSVGRLDMPKDYATFIEASAKVLANYSDVVFVLVGGGPQELSLQKLVTERQIGDRFLLTGWRSDARDIMQIFDIFVSTALQESFGNTLVEAAFLGIPVVAPSVGGVPDVVVDKETGILLMPSEPVNSTYLQQGQALYKKVLVQGQLVPPRSLNSDEVANAITRLIENPYLRFKLGRAGQKRAEILFNLDRYINDLETLYSRFERLK